jgi:hypothetical protein
VHYSKHAKNRVEERNISNRSIALALDIGDKQDANGDKVLYVLEDKLTVVYSEEDSAVITAWHGPPNSSEVSKERKPHWWVEYESGDEGLICPNCGDFRPDVFEAVGKLGAECCGRLYPPVEWIEPTPERFRPDFEDL